MNENDGEEDRRFIVTSAKRRRNARPHLRRLNRKGQRTGTFFTPTVSRSMINTLVHAACSLTAPSRMMMSLVCSWKAYKASAPGQRPRRQCYAVLNRMVLQI